MKWKCNFVEHFLGYLIIFPEVFQLKSSLSRIFLKCSCQAIFELQESGFLLRGKGIVTSSSFALSWIFSNNNNMNVASINLIPVIFAFAWIFLDWKYGRCFSELYSGNFWTSFRSFLLSPEYFLTKNMDNASLNFIQVIFNFIPVIFCIYIWFQIFVCFSYRNRGLRDYIFVKKWFFVLYRSTSGKKLLSHYQWMKMLIGCNGVSGVFSLGKLRANVNYWMYVCPLSYHYR